MIQNLRSLLSRSSNIDTRMNICGIHSLHHHKPKKKKKLRPKPKPKEKPAVFMKTTIQKLSNILRAFPWPSAQQKLEALRLQWDSYTINQVLKTHPPLEMAWKFFNWSKTLKHFKHDQFTYTTMLDIFGEAGRIDQMKSLLQEMEDQGRRIDAVTYTAFMHSLAKAGDIDGALQTWEGMKLKSCPPTVVSYTAIIKILLKNNRPEEAAALYREMLEAGCDPNCYTYTVLIEYLAEQGKFEEAFSIFAEMQKLGVEPSKATCNILVQKCAKAGEMNLMLQVFKGMKDLSLVLRWPIYMEALEALNEAGESDDLLRELHPYFSPETNCKQECVFSGKHIDGYKYDLHTDTLIIRMFLHQGNFTAIESLLDQMHEKGFKLDARTLTAIIHACCTSGKTISAMKAYEYGKNLGVQLDKIAYTSLIGFLMRSNLHQKVVGVVEDMIQKGGNPGIYLLSILISRFGCAGLYGAAQKIFETVPDEQNVVSYTSLINALFKAGNVEKAIEIYEIMIRKHVKPTKGTYEVLQMGLEKAGRHQEATFFKQQRTILLRNEPSVRLDMNTSKTSHWNLCDILFDNVCKVKSAVP